MVGAAAAVAASHPTPHSAAHHSFSARRPPPSHGGLTNPPPSPRSYVSSPILAQRHRHPPTLPQHLAMPLPPLNSRLDRSSSAPPSSIMRSPRMSSTFPSSSLTPISRSPTFSSSMPLSSTTPSPSYDDADDVSDELLTTSDPPTDADSSSSSADLRQQWWRGALAGALLCATLLALLAAVGAVAFSDSALTTVERHLHPPPHRMEGEMEARGGGVVYPSPRSLLSVTAPPAATVAAPTCPPLSSTSPTLSASALPSPLLPSVNHCRLLSLLRRLQQGEAVRVAAIGGSITRHIGLGEGYLEQLTHHLNKVYPPSPKPAPSNSSLPSLRADYHRSITPPSFSSSSPTPLHLPFNRGQSGTSSSFFSLCMSAFFPHCELSTMDLVLVEFGVNDLSYGGDPQTLRELGVHLPFNVDAYQRSAYFQATAQFSSGGEAGEFDPATNMERLVRYILTRHVGQKWNEVGQGGEVRAMDGPAVLLVESCVQDGASAQAWHRPVAYHYGVQLISVCEVLPRLWPTEEAAKALNTPSMSKMMFDQTHPSAAGHAVAAGMIMDRLLTVADAVTDASQQDMCEAQDARLVEAMNGVGGEAEEWGAGDWETGMSSILPSPLFEHNAGLVEWHCTLGEFRQGEERTRADASPDMDATSFNEVDNSGWEYVDDTKKGKWGWQTETVNATLSLQLFPTTRHLVLAYLRTFNNIGAVRMWLSTPTWTGASQVVKAWWEVSFSTFELYTVPEALMPPETERGEPLLFHMRLEDVGSPAQHPVNNSLKAVGNRFKVVSIFQR